MCVKPNVFEI